MNTSTKFNSYRIIIFILLLIINLLSPVIVKTQSDLDFIEIDESFTLYTNVSWSADSRYFTFFSTQGLSPDRNIENDFQGIHVSLDAWWEYDLQSNQLSNQAQWSLQPDLTQSQLNIWQPEEFIYLSPNGNLALFLDSESLFVTIGNILTQETFITTQQGFFNLLNPDGFTIEWSENSNAVVTERPSLGSTIIFYAHIPDPSDVSSTTIYEFEPIQDIAYTVFSAERDRIYDLSESGQFVLLSAREITNDQPIFESPTQVILWNPLDNNNSIIFATDIFQPVLIIDAAFSPNDDTKLLFLHDLLGLVEYDYITGQSRVLDETLTGSDGWFSPDSCWLAVNIDGRFRFIDLLNLPR